MVTEAQIATMLADAVDLVWETVKYGNVNAKNVKTMVDTLELALKGDYKVDIAAGANAIRAQLAGAITSGAIQGMLGPILLTWAKFVSSEAAPVDIAGVIDIVYARMVASADRVLYRNFTRGAVTASGSPAGTGTIYRLNVDENNLPLEASFAEVKTLRCVRDANSGADKHEEVFRIQGAAPAKDVLDLSSGGSGLDRELRAQSARDSLLQNPSFENGSLSTALTGWSWNGTVSTDLELDTTNYYRDYIGETTPASLKLKANGILSQALSVKRTRLNPLKPYYLQLAYNRQVGAGDGTLRIRLGAQTVTVALVAQTGWNILKIPVDYKLWYKSLAEQSMDITVELASRTTGYVEVDDVLLLEWVPIDGGWWLAVGGATPWLRDDLYTATDTEAGGGKIQAVMHRGFGRSLPAAAAAVTFSDP
jgi:hypothetical protein